MFFRKQYTIFQTTTDTILPLSFKLKKVSDKDKCIITQVNKSMQNKNSINLQNHQIPCDN